MASYYVTLPPPCQQANLHKFIGNYPVHLLDNCQQMDVYVLVFLASRQGSVLDGL